MKKIVSVVMAAVKMCIRDSYDAASAIHKIMHNQMADQVRLATVKRGYDPRSFSVVASGGAAEDLLGVLELSYEEKENPLEARRYRGRVRLRWRRYRPLLRPARKIPHDKVGRNVSPVKLHTFYHFHFGFHAFGLFYGNHSFFLHFFHSPVSYTHLV